MYNARKGPLCRIRAMMVWTAWAVGKSEQDLTELVSANTAEYIEEQRTQSAFYVNLYRAVIGRSG